MKRNINEKIPVIMRGISKTINSRFKREGINYRYSGILSDLFYGEGFYINNREKVVYPIKTYGWDMNWAYGGALRNRIFPLTEEITDNKDEAENFHGEYLSFYIITFDKIKSRYKDFYYTLYHKAIAMDIQTKKKICMLTDLDFEIFQDLYEIENLNILKRYYFKHIGFLNMEDIIDKYYKRKKEDNADNKIAYEAGFYGAFAKKLYKKIYSIPAEERIDYLKENKLPLSELPRQQEELNYLLAKELSGNDYPRDKRVPIAIWQAAYLRHVEWKMFKKYQDNVIYMNTDSIYLNEDKDIENSKEIGHYKKEYDGDLILFIRRNAYVVIDEDLNIKKSIIGGVLEDSGLTKKKIKKLLTFESVMCKTYDRNHNIIDIELKPIFALSYWGLDFEIGDLI